MTTQIGIWIDHREARLVWLPENGDEAPRVTTIEGDVESHHKALGGSGTSTPGHLGGSPERRYQRRRGQQLERYLRQVIDTIRDAREIAIFGPGEARGELTAAIEGDKSLRLDIVATERCDRVTEAQLVRKVEAAFRPKATTGPS